MRDSFVIFTEHDELLNDLTDEQAGMVFKGLMAANLDRDVMIDDQAARIVYKAIIAQVNRSHALYDKRVQSGKQGSEKRWADSKAIANDSNAIANDSKAIASDSKRCNPVPVPDIKEILSKESTKKSGFSPPTLQEVQQYIRDKGYNMDAERFVDFYESKGWMVGKNKMKDWKAAVRNWARGQRQGVTTKAGQGVTVNRFNNFKQRQYDRDELERRLLRAQGVSG